jgi:DNA repair protein SbcD/Mre11
VHAREVVHEDPWIVFSGNLQGRQIRESGAKGASLITVHDGHVASVEHRPLDVLRWCPVNVPVAGERNLDGAMARIGRALADAVEAAEGRPIAARVMLTGASPLHGRLIAEPEAIRQGVIAEGRQQAAGSVWIEAIVIGTTSTTDFNALHGRPDVIGRLTKAFDDLIDERRSSCWVSIRRPCCAACRESSSRPTTR